VAVLNVLWQVFTRFVLKDPSSFTEELARYLLIWLSLLGAAYGIGQKKHLSMEYLYLRVSQNAQRKIDLVVDSIVIAFALLVMLIGGSYLVVLTWHLEQISPSLQIPLAYVYSVLPLSGAFMVFYAILSLLARKSGNG
jgi:TRAP-type C4-dicarboxylate transport system permease small subunit